MINYVTLFCNVMLLVSLGFFLYSTKKLLDTLMKWVKTNSDGILKLFDYIAQDKQDIVLIYQELEKLKAQQQHKE